ncbi:putative CoA-transferase subunit alpha [compost metagenome]
MTGPDPYFDHLFARAAQQCFVSCEKLEERLELTAEQARGNTFERYLVTGVVHAPFGAHPTSCPSDYGWDMSHLKRYAASAGEEGGWQAYVDEFVGPGELAYQDKNGGAERLGTLPMPVF